MAALALGLFLGACAGGSSVPATGVGQIVDGRYVLSAEEQALDCRRLNGRLQVRILELRGEEFKTQPTAVSSGMRSVTSTVLLTGTAANADERRARNRPMLEAYNRRLGELGCPSYDLTKELAARPSAPSPSPTIPPPASAAKAAQ